MQLTRILLQYISQTAFMHRGDGSDTGDKIFRFVATEPGVVDINFIHK